MPLTPWDPDRLADLTKPVWSCFRCPTSTFLIYIIETDRECGKTYDHDDDDDDDDQRKRGRGESTRQERQ